MAWQPTYATAEELADYVRTDSLRDADTLELAVAAASRAVDQFCHRQFGSADSAAERIYTPRWDRRRGRWVVDIDDLGDKTGLTLDLGAGEVATFTLEPVNAMADGRPWTVLTIPADASPSPTGDEHELTATGLWGWPQVPQPVKQATLLQASRLHHRRESPWGVAGSPELGSEMRLLARVDPDVAVGLTPYVRWWGAR